MTDQRSAATIWLLAVAAIGIALFVAFCIWFTRPATMSSTEIAIFVAKYAEQEKGYVTESELERMTAFLNSDDGQAFEMLNLVVLYPQAKFPDSHKAMTGREAVDAYGVKTMWPMLSRAIQPVQIINPVIQLSSHDRPNLPEMSVITSVRYPNRRSLIAMATSAEWEAAAIYKNAGVKNNIMTPSEIKSVSSDPRLLWGLGVLLTLAALRVIQQGTRSRIALLLGVTSLVFALVWFGPRSELAPQEARELIKEIQALPQSSKPDEQVINQLTALAEAHVRGSVFVGSLGTPTATLENVWLNTQPIIQLGPDPEVPLWSAVTFSRYNSVRQLLESVVTGTSELNGRDGNMAYVAQGIRIPDLRLIFFGLLLLSVYLWPVPKAR